MKSIIILDKPIPMIMEKDYLNRLNLSEEFKIFSKEAIIFASLEYSRYTREMTDHNRLLYLYDKCVEFEGNSLITYTPKTFISLLQEGYYENNSNDVDDLPF